jgi:CheY-like chemotaxis protein
LSDFLRPICVRSHQSDRVRPSNPEQRLLQGLAMEASRPLVALQGQSDPARRRVLVVDDDAPSRRAVARLLEVEGYDARVAADGEEAAALVGSWQPHLVLTDLNMPRLDGRGLLQRVRRESPGTPVIVLTARPTEGVPSLEQLGAAGFFSKPVAVDELLARIHRLID